MGVRTRGLDCVVAAFLSDASDGIFGSCRDQISPSCE